MTCPTCESPRAPAPPAPEARRVPESRRASRIPTLASTGIGPLRGPDRRGRLRLTGIRCVSASYAPDAGRGLVRFTHHLRHDAALRLAGPAPGQQVLGRRRRGAACSRGAWWRWGCEVTAVDASEAMIRRPREVSPSAEVARLETLSRSAGASTG